MGSRPALRALYGLALVLAGTAVAAGPPEWSARIRVSFVDDPRGAPRADVDTELRWIGKSGARPAAVDVGMAEDGFPGGYGSFLRDFTPKAQVLSTPGGRFRIPVPEDGMVRLRYGVALEHDASTWGPGPDEAPYRFDGGAFWTGRALFVTPDRTSATVTLVVRGGRKVAVSYDPVAGPVGTYRVPSEARLRNAFLVVGRYETIDLRVGDAHVMLVLGPNLAASMPVVTGAVRRFLDASERIFDGAPPSRILVVANLGAAPGSMYGGVFGSDISVLLYEPPTTSNAPWWRSFLCHEIFHLWNGTAIDFPAGQQYWFTEGVTEYESKLIPVRLGEETDDEFLRTMSQKAARYLETEAIVGLLRAGDEKFLNNALVYDGGALAAMSLDVAIRARSGNRKSLDDLLRELYRRAQARKGRGLTQEDIEKTAVKLAGSGVKEFFRRYVRGDERLPLAEALRPAGLTLTVESVELPETTAILGDLLRCPSVTVVRQGLLVNVTTSDTLRSGDIITEVEHAPVRDFEELRRAFQRLRRGSRIHVAVVRDGAPVDLQVVLARTDGVPIERSRTVRVSIVPDADADPSAVAIRKSLFVSGS